MENVTINGLNASSCITINNSNVYFIIKNSNLHNASEYSGSAIDKSYNAGIKLTNVTNGKLLNNNCSNNNWFGIYIYNGFNNSIIENEASYNLFNGIELLYGENSLVLGNELNYNDRKGIEISYSYNSTIWGNTANFNEWGISVGNSDGSTVKNNVANNNGHYGIDLSSEHIYVQGNTANDNQVGIYLDWNGNNYIYGNTANDNLIGIDLWNSNHNLICYNNVSRNSQRGIRLYGSISCYNNTVIGNRLNLNHDGIQLNYNCWNNTIKDNMAYDNPSSGITLINGCSFNTISGNMLLRNYYGLSLANSFNNTILANNASSNTWFGIDLYQSENNTLSDNIIGDNSEDGIYLSRSENNTISKNIIKSNLRFGVFLIDHSDFNNITWNYIEDNARGIELFLKSNDNFIGGNDVIRNSEEGFYLEDCTGLHIVKNLIINNSAEGIIIHNCNDSVIYHNYLIGNSPNAVDNGFNNEWSWISEGNYWDDYSGVDINGDGVGDTPYNIPGTAGSQDNFPIYDDKPPLVSVDLSLNGTYIDSRPRINVSAFDPNMDSIWYEINGQQVTINSGIEVFIDDQIWIGLADGTFIVKIYAIDLIGHINDSYSLILYKDTANPIISINSPIEDQEFGAQAPTYDFDLDEIYLDTIWYVIISEGSTPHIISSTSGAINENIWDSLDDGEITIRFYANDTLGHEGYSEVIIIKNTSTGSGTPVILGFDTFTVIAIISLITTILIWRKKMLNFDK
ncbi:MAG: right-handed parallel beta-helix repeat-containing protein [Promethearchaeota archaeon]